MVRQNEKSEAIRTPWTLTNRNKHINQLTEKIIVGWIDNENNHLPYTAPQHASLAILIHFQIQLLDVY